MGIRQESELPEGSHTYGCTNIMTNGSYQYSPFSWFGMALSHRYVFSHMQVGVGLENKKLFSLVMLREDAFQII